MKVIVSILTIALFFAAAFGWGSNIVELATHLSTMEAGEAVTRCLGVVIAPLGAVLGYF